MTYLLLKSFHIVSVVSWMAGLLYLPRLFVYHSSAKIGSELSETFKVMERRLFTMIMCPALVATWLSGIFMIVLTPDLLQDIWFIIKLFVVVFMTIMHFIMGRWRIAFSLDANVHSDLYFRIANEIPTLGLLIVVPLVVLKPW